MKKVLFILGDFWPVNSGGTIRVAKLIKYLPEYNWEGVVLTRKLEEMKSAESIQGTQIYRTRAFDLPVYYQRVKEIFEKFSNKKVEKKDNVSNIKVNNQRLADNFFVPDVGIIWALGSVFRLKSIIKKDNITVVYSSSPFSSSHIPVLLYVMFFNKTVKWIVEFRDPWIFNPFRTKKIFLLEKIDNFLEKKVLMCCDDIIVTSQEYKDEFLKKYKFLDSKKINFIPNGFDSDDFLGLKKTRTNKKITVVHAGNFYGKRSLRPFLEALQSIYTQYPDCINILKFVQYGAIDPIGELYHLNHPNPLVEIKEVIPHRDSLQETMNADWLLLVSGPGNGTMPGKLYEYLAVGKPIIALVDDGPAKQLIQDLDIGYVINAEDVLLIKKSLLEILMFKSKYKSVEVISEQVLKFERKNIAKQVSKVLEFHDEKSF